MDWKNTKTGYGWLPVALHWLIHVLIGLHAAALFHHYVKRDNTLRLMLGR